MGDAASVLVRVWLPDRPGALGLVASRIGAVRGDIVGIDVLERGEGVVIDEFAVNLGDLDLLKVLISEIEEVDGASVEEVRIVARFPDPRIDALSPPRVCARRPSTAALADRLVEQTRREFLSEWSALLRDGELLAAAGEAPPIEQLEALARGTLTSPSVADGETARSTWRSRAWSARRGAPRGPRRSDVPAPRAGAAPRPGPHRRPGVATPGAEPYPSTTAVTKRWSWRRLRHS